MIFAKKVIYWIAEYAMLKMLQMDLVVDELLR